MLNEFENYLRRQNLSENTIAAYTMSVRLFEQLFAVVSRAQHDKVRVVQGERRAAIDAHFDKEKAQRFRKSQHALRNLRRLRHFSREIFPFAAV